MTLEEYNCDTKRYDYEYGDGFIDRVAEIDVHEIYGEGADEHEIIARVVTKILNECGENKDECVVWEAGSYLDEKRKLCDGKNPYYIRARYRTKIEQAEATLA
jgi:hypothetical protein